MAPKDKDLSDALINVFGSKMKLYTIRGDGNCFWRCFGVILYSLFQILKSASDTCGKMSYEKFKTDFELILDALNKCDSLKSAENIHHEIRKLVNAKLITIFSDNEFVDAVKKGCENDCEARQGEHNKVCSCSLKHFFEVQNRETTSASSILRFFLFQAIVSEATPQEAMPSTEGKLSQSLVEKTNPDSLSGIMRFIRKNSQTCEHSGILSLLVLRDLLKDYCSCPEIIYHTNTKRLTLPGDNEVIRGHGLKICTSFLVLYSNPIEALNHYEILIPAGESICMSPSEIEEQDFFITATRNELAKKVIYINLNLTQP